MKYIIRKRLQVLFYLLLINIFALNSINAQSGGTVYGVINDGGSNTSLPGATISIQGMSYGTITDPYGKYTLTNIPEGKVTLQYSYVGYTDELVEIEITKGATIEKNVVMIMDMQNLSEVVVSAQLLGQTKAINQQLNSDALMNAVSEDKIKDLPDVNAAEAIGRIPGIAVQRESGEGQKIMIRGLEPKFSAITINGVRMASNSSTDKSVDLSMISPELLAGIEVYKSPTPDMDAEAVGGSVNLIIKKAPTKQRANLKLEGGYNSINSSFGNYAIAADASKRFFNNKFGVIAQVNTQQVDRSNYLLGSSNTTQLEGGENVLHFRYFELSDIEEIRKRSGASINLDLELGQGNISLYSFYSKTKRNVFQQSERYNALIDNELRFTNLERNLDLDILSTALRGDHKIGNVLFDWSLSQSITNNNTPFEGTMDFRQDGAYLTNPPAYNYNEWFSQANKDYNDAYLRESRYITNKVKEDFSTAILNIKVPFVGGDAFSGFLKFGGKYTVLNRERDLNESIEPNYYLGGELMRDAIARYNNPITYTDAKGLIATSSFFNGGNSAANTIFKEGYPFNLDFNRTYVNNWTEAQKDYYLSNRKEDVEDYAVVERVTAAYVMAKFEFGETLTLIPGMRFERSNNDYSGSFSTLTGLWGDTGTTFDTTTFQQYNEFLPHLHLTFKPLQWLSIKASAVKTIARPNYNYITPRSLVDINTNQIDAGNPELKHMESWNYDLNISFYNGRYGLFTAGIFYKDMKNIFYAVENFYFANDSLADAAGYTGRKNYYLSSYENSPEANVWGLEFDLQTNLKFLPSPFNGVVLSANFSRLFSETQKYWFTSSDSTFRDPVTGKFITVSEVFSHQRKITIPGQVPYILNLSVGYDYKGFSSRISGVYQGTFLKTPGTTDLTNNYSWQFWRWDVSLKQKINKYFSVYANVTNLNQQREEEFLNNSTAYPRRIQEFKLICNLGVQAKF